MQKVLFVFAIGLLSLGSCKKSGCWRCTTTFSSQNSSLLPPSGAAARATYCDKTEAEIRQIEKDGTGTQTTVQNGKTYTSTAKTTCK